MKCLSEKCENELTGRQKKFCSNICKCYYNNRHNGYGSSYTKQKERGIKRKEEFIQLKGGACKYCGYDKCIASLTFHHREPSFKSFELDMRSLSNRTYEICLEELNKCDLLCFNCHMELHYNE